MDRGSIRARSGSIVLRGDDDMTERVEIGGIKVASVLQRFVNEEALPGTGITPETFWAGLTAILRDLAPRNRALLQARDALQHKIDDYHRSKAGHPLNAREYERFLRDIGYLV